MQIIRMRRHMPSNQFRFGRWSLETRDCLKAEVQWSPTYQPKNGATRLHRTQIHKRDAMLETDLPMRWFHFVNAPPYCKWTMIQADRRDHRLFSNGHLCLSQSKDSPSRKAILINTELHPVPVPALQFEHRRKIERNACQADFDVPEFNHKKMFKKNDKVWRLTIETSVLLVTYVIIKSTPVNVCGLAL